MQLQSTKWICMYVYIYIAIYVTKTIIIIIIGVISKFMGVSSIVIHEKCEHMAYGVKIKL
jgi:hypothetical protein